MPRAVTPLTDSAIKAAKPKSCPYKLGDGQGLYLEVMPNGSKLWRLKYRYAGKESRLALGAYPARSLVKARQARAEIREQLAAGIDPALQRKVERQADAAGESFEALAQEWFDYNKPRWAEATADKAAAYLKSDLLPAIGHRPAKAITRPELVALVRTIEDRGAHNVAKKTRQWLSQIFRYGLAKGTVDSNPATDLDVVAAVAPTIRHHPHVAFSDLAELLGTLESAKQHIITRTAIKVLMLTGVRPGELRMAPWAEFDLDAAVWTIPAARMKARRPHVVPLPRQAVIILRSLYEVTGNYPLAFPGQHNAARPMSENTVNKALKVMGYEGKQTGHGFRHLISTELNGRGYNRDWIEKQLAHGDADAIRDTYNHAAYLEQRRQMMQEWADSIDALQAGANVVGIRSRG